MNFIFHATGRPALACRSPKRNSLTDQGGAFLALSTCVCGLWFIGLKVYAGILAVCGAANKQIPDSGMQTGASQAAISRSPAC
jgi:hypothetical protein